MKNARKGFVTLISVILISAILIMDILQTAYNSFNVRENLSQVANEEEAESLTQSCLNTALIWLAQNPDYQPKAGGDTLYVGVDYRCLVEEVEVVGVNNWIVTTSASVRDNQVKKQWLVKENGTSFEIVPRL